MIPGVKKFDSLFILDGKTTLKSCITFKNFSSYHVDEQVPDLLHQLLKKYKGCS